MQTMWSQIIIIIICPRTYVWIKLCRSGFRLHKNYIQYSGHGKVILEFLWNIFVITYTELFEEMCVCVFCLFFFEKIQKGNVSPHIFTNVREKRIFHNFIFPDPDKTRVGLRAKSYIWMRELGFFYRNLQFFYVIFIVSTCDVFLQKIQRALFRLKGRNDGIYRIWGPSQLIESNLKLPVCMEPDKNNQLRALERRVSHLWWREIKNVPQALRGAPE